MSCAINHPRKIPTALGGRRGLLLIVPGLMLASLVLAARGGDEAERAAADLQKLRGEIQALQERLEHTRGERDAARTALRESEREIGALVSELRQLAARHKTETRRLAALRTEQAKSRALLEGQRAALARQLRLSHALGQQAALKMWLNPREPAALARVHRYHHYFHDARSRRIASARSALAGIEAQEQGIARQLRDIARLTQNELEKKRSLEASRARRARLLAQLSEKLSGQAQEIERLRRDEQGLKRLVGELGQYFGEPRARAAPARPGARFPDQRGRLALPTRGRIVARYGEPKLVGDLKWKGIFLAAPEGQEIQAVFPGRVAYADWLRGFGLLLVLEHGDGYMTLYGHNQSLYQAVGERVEAGQVIASIGNTGGAPRSGLYFEIRHNGEPHDPLQWCKVK